MKLQFIRTDGENSDFIENSRLLDMDLDRCVGKEVQRDKYSRYNQLEKLKSHQVSLIESEECRKAAVCIALLFTEDGPEIILEVRSARLGEQPGDISLPGGMICWISCIQAIF